MKNQIRLAVLNNEAQNLRELFLAKSQISNWHEIVEFRLFTASELASAWDISVQNASSKLNRFYRSGYLDREEVIADSGGIEFVYSVPEGLKASARTSTKFEIQP